MVAVKAAAGGFSLPPCRWPPGLVQRPGIPCWPVLLGFQGLVLTLNLLMVTPSATRNFVRKGRLRACDIKEECTTNAPGRPCSAGRCPDVADLPSGAGAGPDAWQSGAPAGGVTGGGRAMDDARQGLREYAVQRP